MSVDNFKNNKSKFKKSDEDNKEEEIVHDLQEESLPKLSIRDHDIADPVSSFKRDSSEKRHGSRKGSAYYTTGARDLRNDEGIVYPSSPLHTESQPRSKKTSLRESVQFEESQESRKLKTRKQNHHLDTDQKTRRSSAQDSQRSSFFSTVKYYFSMLVFATACVLLYHVTVNTNFDLISKNTYIFFGKTTTEDVFVPLKLVNYMPAAKCYPVSTEEFSFFKTDKDWNHVVKSMLYYMINEDLDSISTFHVGHASCFMMIHQEDGSILSMFNPNFKGYHDTVYVRVNEVSVACPHITRVVERANTIIMTYNEIERGELVIEKFNNTQAWTAQATGFYLKGKTTCDSGKSTTDYGRVTLKEEIEDYLKH